MEIVTVTKLQHVGPRCNPQGKWDYERAEGEIIMSYRVTMVCLSAAFATALAAQDLPKTQVKVIGLNSPTPVSIYDELPFWRKTIPEASKGAITADCVASRTCRRRR